MFDRMVMETFEQTAATASYEVPLLRLAPSCGYIGLTLDNGQAACPFAALLRPAMVAACGQIADHGDPAQVNGRDELAIPEKVALDAEYLRRQGFIFDLRILFMTAIKVARAAGVKH